MAGAAHAHTEAPDVPLAAFEQTDEIFADFGLDKHIPGLVYGVVANGQLVHVGSYGMQDLGSKRPATPDPLFRIASMISTSASSSQ